MKWTGLLAAILLVSAGLAAWPREQPAGPAAQKKIKKGEIKGTSASSGQGMFKEYCAVCHGKEAKGDGPAASELKVRPPDLTTLAKRNDGKFPEARVVSILKFGAEAPAHGQADMPVWGPLFKSLNATGSGGDAQVQQRIANLTHYLESLQVK
jgi:mono/diheme cytochrome c family protein